MYAHKLTAPQSSFIKYRGNTGQIDVKDTVISILSKNPGLYGAQIAKLIYDQKLFPRSFGYVYEVLQLLGSEGSVIRNGRYYYLTGDAVSHDMAVTADVVEKLAVIGVDLTKARFLSSAIIMAGENAIAEANGENFNLDETVATGVATAPEETTSIQITSEEYGWVPEEDFCEYPGVKFEKNEDGNYTISGTLSDIDQFCGDFDIDLHRTMETPAPELPENLEIDDPFASMGNADRESLKEAADALIAADYAQEQQDIADSIAFELKQKKERAVSEIKTASDMLEKTVEINPGKFDGQVIGSVIDVRPTGMTFLITHSTDDAVEFGTVMPLEYSSGLTYKLVFDFDAE